MESREQVPNPSPSPTPVTSGLTVAPTFCPSPTTQPGPGRPAPFPRSRHRASSPRPSTCPAPAALTEPPSCLAPAAPPQLDTHDGDSRAGSSAYPTADPQMPPTRPSADPAPPHRPRQLPPAPLPAAGAGGNLTSAPAPPSLPHCASRHRKSGKGVRRRRRWGGCYAPAALGAVRGGCLSGRVRGRRAGPEP